MERLGSVRDVGNRLCWCCVLTAGVSRNEDKLVRAEQGTREPLSPVVE